MSNITSVFGSSPSASRISCGMVTWLFVVTRTRGYCQEKYDYGTAPAGLRTVEQIQVTTHRFQSSSDIPLVSASGPSIRSPPAAHRSRAPAGSPE